MYTEVLRAIDGIAVFPVISLVLFVAVFSTMLVLTARMDRRRLDRLAQLPLDDPNHPAPQERAR
jgi:hypothetical protein